MFMLYCSASCDNSRKCVHKRNIKKTFAIFFSTKMFIIHINIQFYNKKQMYAGQGGKICREAKFALKVLFFS